MDTPDLSRLKIDRSAGTHQGGLKRPRRRRWLKIGIAALIIAAVAIALVSRFGASPRVETFTAVTAYPSQNYTMLNATGYVVAQRKAAVASKATGRLEWLGVLEGSRVKKDEIVARLENSDVSAVLNQAAANVKVAQANLEQGMAELRDAELAYRRSQDLLRQNFISASAGDAALARYNKARAAISGFRAAIAAAQANQQNAQVAVDQTMIRAPFDGVVLTRNANVGDNITPFSSAIDSKGAVITIADMETLEVEADVSEANLARIKVDQPCEIQLDAFPDLRLAGVVSRMVPTIDRSKATLLVKVRFIDRDPRVLPDMSAKVAFLSQAVPPQDRQSVIAVPPAAVTDRNGGQAAFIVTEGKVREQQVKIGRKVGELIEVQGIKPGDKVVLHPGSQLKDGDTVATAKK
ncbi:efflux RND transporter periplasmic adaptor subunit [Noviherbaspirillum cavernae]|uniref:Efflux RND transporter periplasmic adaptor subunit n=1 Tax=Noviherbaspirillum cavernae TaxID=2320862 RepID=A0A418X6B8_9BURK|nr:efflux RND transporter periplasmic adaptor subunit [Noviherbaspirillum cavernae]RJG08008.1 efflux RND transporter periplasmic adaptor subunit [Noviherbaspirillum cavernae]